MYNIESSLLFMQVTFSCFMIYLKINKRQYTWYCRLFLHSSNFRCLYFGSKMIYDVNFILITKIPFNLTIVKGSHKLFASLGICRLNFLAHLTRRVM